MVHFLISLIDLLIYHHFYSDWYIENKNFSFYTLSPYLIWKKFKLKSKSLCFFQVQFYAKSLIHAQQVLSKSSTLSKF